MYNFFCGDGADSVLCYEPWPLFQIGYGSIFLMGAIAACSPIFMYFWVRRKDP